MKKLKVTITEKRRAALVKGRTALKKKRASASGTIMLGEVTHTKGGHRKLPWNELAVGGMFFVPIEANREMKSRPEAPASQLQAWVSQLVRRRNESGLPGQFFVMRMDKDGQEGVGVWRVK